MRRWVAYALVVVALAGAWGVDAAEPTRRPSSGAHAAVDPTQVNVAAEIAAAARGAPAFRVSAPAAAQRLDLLLAQHYQARGSIAGEPNAELKRLYVQAAHLLMNGYPIAGVTLVHIARQRPAFTQSKVGPALARFTDGMLVPTGEPDDDLEEYARRADAARAKLGGVRPLLQLGAELQVMGGIYGDPVAAAAGRSVLARQGATRAELAAVTAAERAGGVR